MNRFIFHLWRLDEYTLFLFAQKDEVAVYSGSWRVKIQEGFLLSKTHKSPFFRIPSYFADLFTIS
jgi:hypothetical protein